MLKSCGDARRRSRPKPASIFEGVAWRRRLLEHVPASAFGGNWSWSTPGTRTVQLRIPGWHAHGTKTRRGAWRGPGPWGSFGPLAVGLPPVLAAARRGHSPGRLGRAALLGPWRSTTGRSAIHWPRGRALFPVRLVQSVDIAGPLVVEAHRGCDPGDGGPTSESGRAGNGDSPLKGGAAARCARHGPKPLLMKQGPVASHLN